MSCLNFSNLTTESIEKVLNEFIVSNNKFNDDLVNLNNNELSWNAYIQKNIDFDESWLDKLIVFEMNSFHPEESIRDICNKCETILSEYAIEQSMRKDLFEKFKYYYYNQYQTEKVNFTPERIRYIEETMKSYRINGLELPEDKYERVKEIKKEISTMSINFSQNLNNYNKEFILTKEQLVEKINNGENQKYEK